MKTRPYKRHVLPFLLLLLAMLVLGPGTSAAEETKLSLFEATAALSRMVLGKDWDAVPHARPVPPADQFKMDKAGQYTAGPWAIRLERRTFVFTLSHKDGGFWQRSGICAQDDKLKWQAKVERELRTAHCALTP
ncbi:hypothetical protein [Roseimicrobium sp. ORNL1]|uniref:hypothetical protein n=1 Tax=Roseimicrobium sp. ORNL1 TaxID=2711231 RepID=UPI0013E1F252|nr:hypothetical protein [Roseimicrobium sp. ORNL1]QIF01021.1 hypothetical protein G5S37_05640 [Roseimicrobium sp. ORNL1]